MSTIIKDASMVVRLTNEFNYHLTVVCNKYKDITGKRLTKQEAIMKLIERNEYLLRFCASDETKKFFNITVLNNN